MSNEEIGIFITPDKESKIFFRIEKLQLEIWNKEPNNERQLIAKISGKGRSFNSIWASTSDGKSTELQMVEIEGIFISSPFYSPSTGFFIYKTNRIMYYNE